MEDHADVMKILLSKGANVSAAADGWTALHYAALAGKLSATLVLAKATADLDALDQDGMTPLHLAAMNGHSEVMTALITAGANIDSRSSDGSTPLYAAALGGHIDAVRVLLQAKGNPLLANTSPPGCAMVPLDVAALQGHSEVVRELIQHVGIEGCGGESGGVHALKAAAQDQRVGVMSILADAGVVDTGKVLGFAADHGLEAAVKFLLQQHEKGKTAGGTNYVDSTRGRKRGRTPLMCSIVFAHSPRVARLHVDAGADTTLALDACEVLADMPKSLSTSGLRGKLVNGKPATHKQLHRLEAIRRLLLQVEAVHAVSWLWTREMPLMGDVIAEHAQRAKVASNPLTQMLQMMKRRPRVRRVVLASPFRYSSKP